METILVNIKNQTSSVEESSEGISEISKNMESIFSSTQKTIKISEQTNLLALNAAIEAARAGEAGRGFSIVAEEVRKLADMTKTSANDIGKMLNTAKDTMKQNLYLAEHSGEQLKEIINKVEKTNEEIEIIADENLETTNEEINDSLTLN